MSLRDVRTLYHHSLLVVAARHPIAITGCRRPGGGNARGAGRFERLAVEDIRAARPSILIVVPYLDLHLQWPDKSEVFLYSSGQPFPHGEVFTPKTWKDNTGIRILRLRKHGSVRLV